jgi:hypothetical protein
MTQIHSAGRRVGVQFDYADEFLAELAQDAADDRVERGIVRVTRAYRYSTTGAYRQLSVVAGYADAQTGRPVVLEQIVGDDWGDDFPNTPHTRQRASDLIARLRETSTALGLTVRAGRFSDLPTPTIDTEASA